MSAMDVAVLGGGPAGLAAAIALRQRGCCVALYDGQRPPIDKACGEGLMPEAVRLLRTLGLTLDERDGAPLAGVSFHDAHTQRKRRIQQRQRTGRAPHAPAGTHGGAGGGDGHCAALGRCCAARWRRWLCIGRHGDSSGLLCDRRRTVLDACGSQRLPRARTVTACAMRAVSNFSARRGATAWRCTGRAREQLYVTPLGDDEVGVALLTSMRGRRLSDALPDFPAVANRLAGAARTSSMRGAVTRTRSLREVIRGNVAVLGDASGSVDAVTGEGLLSALRQATCAGRCHSRRRAATLCCGASADLATSAAHGAASAAARSLSLAGAGICRCAWRSGRRVSLPCCACILGRAELAGIGVERGRGAAGWNTCDET